MLFQVHERHRETIRAAVSKTKKFSDPVAAFIAEHHRPLIVVTVFIAAAFFLINYHPTVANTTVRTFSAECSGLDNGMIRPGTDVDCAQFSIQQPAGVMPTRAAIVLDISVAEHSLNTPQNNEQENEVQSEEEPLNESEQETQSDPSAEAQTEGVSESEVEVVPEPAAENLGFLDAFLFPKKVFAQEPVFENNSAENKSAESNPSNSEPDLQVDTETESDGISSESTTEEVLTSEIAPFPYDVDDQFFAVQYSLDGETWKDAGIMDGAHVTNANFDITDQLGADLENIETILIRLHGLDFSGVDITINQVAIEISYQEIPEILNPPTITITDSSLMIAGESSFASGDSPVFTVSDPGLTVAAVVALVDENKAEVVADIANVLELPAGESPTAMDVILQNTVTPVLDAVQQTVESIVEPVMETVVDPVVSSLKTKRAYADEPVSMITSAVVLDSDGNETDVTVTITTVIVDGVEKQQVTINKPSREFRPGRYILKITLHTPQVIIITEQDFTWGVLSMNMEKSMYHAGESAYLQMGVLDDQGNTICDADLELSITSPSGVVTSLTTDSETIVKNSECGPNNVISTPDYYTHFTPTELGDYDMRLIATTANGTKSIIDHLRVVGPIAFEVKRSGPTRIYPVEKYPVTLKITSTQDWAGTITETVPTGFEITPPLHSVAYNDVQIDGDVKKISWNISLAAGQETTIGYYFDAPDISPEFYLIGPLTFYEGTTDIFHEAREWQIASDATCAATTSGSWNTGGNWTGCSGTAGRPGTGDNITINSGITITMDANSAVLGTITVNGTLNTSNGTSRSLTGTTLTIGSTGTLTANASTITLSGTTGTPISMTAGGTFTAGTSTVTLTGNNAGGNSTIPSNITYANVTTNITGETFVLNGSTTMTGTLTITLGTVDTTASNYALSAGKISIANSASASFLANASTISLTATTSTLFAKGASGTFTAGTSTVDVTGTGDVTVNSGTGAFYNLTISGTGTKTLAAASVVTNTLAINAGTVTNAGTLSAGFITIGTAGTFAPGTSAVTMTGTTGTLLSITGSGVFTGGTSTITITGNGSNTINTSGFTGSNALFNLTINITGVTKSLGADLTATGTVTITVGTLDTTGSNYTLSAGKISLANNAAAFFLANGSTINLTNGSGTLFAKGSNGTFTVGTSTVNMTGNGDATISSGTPTFYNLTISGTGTKTSGSMTVSNVFTISAGTVSGGTGTITLSGTTGTPFVNSATFDGGTGTVVFTGDNGSGNTTIPSSPTYYNLTVNNTSETYVLSGTTNVTALVTVTLGTFDTGSNYALNAANLNVANSTSAIFNANASTITLSNPGGTLITRGVNGVFNAGTSTILITSASGTPRLASAAITVHALVINSTATIVNAGAVITTDNVAGNGITITAGVFNDGGNQIVAGTGSTLTVAAGATLCLGGHATSSTASCDSGGTVTSTGAGATTIPAFSTISLDAASTVIYLGNNALTVSTTPTYGNLYFRPVITAARTYTVTGALTIAGSFSTLPISSTGTFALTVTMTGTWNITGSFSISGTGSSPAKTTFSTGTNRTLNVGGSVTLGDGTSATTFAANASAISVGGGWTNYAAFSGGTSNVTFNTGTTATITGATSFYDLTITHSSVKEVNFATTGSPVFDVTHTFTVTGHSGGLIKLYSDASPTQWNFNPTGTAVVDYADVKDGACEPGAITIYTTNSTDSTNNDSCWDFGVVAQTLSFTLSTNSIGFGTLSTAAARYGNAAGTGSSSDTVAHTVAVATNATTGYTLSVRGATLTSGANTIAAIGGSNMASSAGTEQFGIRADASGGLGTVSSPYAASGFAYAGTASTASTIGSATTGDGNTTTYSIHYLGNISPTTKPGSYSSNITYVVTGNF